MPSLLDGAQRGSAGGVPDDNRRFHTGDKKEIDQFEGQRDGEEDEGGKEEKDGGYPKNTGEDESGQE